MFVTGALPKSVYPPLFNRYSGSANSFGSHIDSAARTHAATARHVHTDISCTLFLSDPAGYDGSKLVVQDTFDEQRIKLDAGDLVMYAGTSVHRVEPVTHGERRRLLYDMVMAITALRCQNQQLTPAGPPPESAEVVTLTGSFHNLLRMWADV